MQWEWSIVLLIGTFVALLGFLKWPRSSYELIHPRFVVPGVIWVATFGQALVRAKEGYRAGFYEAARVEYGDAALWYTILAMLCFYVGMLLPIGRAIADPLAGLETSIRISPRSIRKIGWWGTWLLLLFFLLVSGPRALGVGSLGGLIASTSPVFLKISAVVVSVGAIFNAAMLGVSWPVREERNLLTHVMMVLGLFVNSMYTMPAFSRGVGLAAFVAAMAYSVRVRRFNPLVMGAAVLWVALCAHAGLAGRGIHGRESDVPTYLSTIVQYSIFDPMNVLHSGFGLNDCFTSLAISMKAVTRADVRPMSQLGWVVFQIPIPHWFEIFPKWTVDLALYVGGYGTWHYTTGMLGDTYIHWGWFGPLWFILTGIVYRFTGDLTFRTRSGDPGSISAYSIVLFSSYYAIGVGVFNTYRAWVMGYSFPLALICLFLIARKMFGGTAPQAQEHCPPPIPEYTVERNASGS